MAAPRKTNMTCLLMLRVCGRYHGCSKEDKYDLLANVTGVWSECYGCVVAIMAAPRKTNMTCLLMLRVCGRYHGCSKEDKYDLLANVTGVWSLSWLLQGRQI